MIASLLIIYMTFFTYKLYVKKVIFDIIDNEISINH